MNTEALQRDVGSLRTKLFYVSARRLRIKDNGFQTICCCLQPGHASAAAKVAAFSSRRCAWMPARSDHRTVSDNLHSRWAADIPCSILSALPVAVSTCSLNPAHWTRRY